MNKLLKIGTVVLLFYTLLAGLLIPLDVGLTGVAPTQLHPGKQKVKAYYYMQHLQKNMKVDVWAFHKDNSILCSHVKVLDEQSLEFQIQVPDVFPSRNVGLVVQTANNRDTLHGALYFMSTQVGESTAKAEAPPVKAKLIDVSLSFPNREILRESIRNLFYHVPMWFTLILLGFVSMVAGIRYLRNGSMQMDIWSENCARVGLLFGVLGLVTGSLWARFTWGQWWVTEDLKLNGAAFTVLIYLAYVILRGSIQDEIQRARISAIYNIFGFVMMMVFVMVVPRLADSLHPGNGGNPAFSSYDLDSTMRLVFYPAVLAWMGLGWWIVSVKVRMSNLRLKLLNR